MSTEEQGNTPLPRRPLGAGGCHTLTLVAGLPVRLLAFQSAVPRPQATRTLLETASWTARVGAGGLGLQVSCQLGVGRRHMNIRVFLIESQAGG